MKPAIGSGPAAKDWQQMRARLARACDGLAEEQRLSPERARAILEERARLLARVPPQAPSAAEVVEVLIFSLGNERYAIETAHVCEILRCKDVTPLPGAPDAVAGVINLRGEIVALFDLTRFLGLATPANAADGWTIVLGSERAELGVRADAVSEVIRLANDQVLEAPASMAGSARDLVRGVTPEAVIVLDGAVLLKDARFFVDQGEDNEFASPGVKS